MKKLISTFYEPIKRRLIGLSARESKNAVLLGRLLAAYQKNEGVESLEDVEFSVFSQFGEDGIIQYLINHAISKPLARTFVEIGVENYEESNTRFLLCNNKWKGVVFDGNSKDIEYINQSEIVWRTSLNAIAAFVDRDNINGLIQSAGAVGEIGLLSIDVDGNDYWLWDAIAVVDPVVVICEFNRYFGPRAAITIPYQAGFVHKKSHPSEYFYGASLAGLVHLASEKNYDFIGCTSEGVNAFFVKRSYAAEVPKVTVEEAMERVSVRAPAIDALQRFAKYLESVVVDVRTEQEVTLGYALRNRD